MSCQLHTAQHRNGESFSSMCFTLHNIETVKFLSLLTVCTLFETGRRERVLTNNLYGLALRVMIAWYNCLMSIQLVLVWQLDSIVLLHGKKHASGLLGVLVSEYLVHIILIGLIVSTAKHTCIRTKHVQ